MREIIITCMLFVFCLQANAQRLPEKPIQKKENQKQAPARIISTDKGSDTIPLRQVDGTVLHIIGVGNTSMFEAYTETIDGYTIVMAKDGFYYYAVQTKDGNLLPSDVRAKDPENRTKKEQKKLASLPKHLRYSGEKLQEIAKKQKDFYKDHNIEIERSNAK